MYTKKSFSFKLLINTYGLQLAWYGPYLIIVFYTYRYLGFENLDIKMSIATVLGFAVALLLGFRTSASYDRWWEARKIWGGIINDSRTLTRQAIGFTTHKGEFADEVKQMVSYQIALVLSLKNSLRNLDPLKETKPFLSKDEVKYLESKNNKPNEILKLLITLISKLKVSGKIDSYQQVSLDKTVNDLCDQIGKAERIKNTVFPTHYKSYTHIGLMIYTVMLPFGMLYSSGPFVILICLLVSFFFNMLESIAAFLQDPFMNRESDIPMSSICRTIEINLKELVGDSDIPEPISPDKNGVLM